ncbi:hypothetical protein H0H93_014160 [Arthromyces matolae]|nr:hypothetical protein H0H93_014160 [Arthromyces matolae]
MAEAALHKISSNKAFEGELSKYKFKSAALGGLDARFNLFLPPNAAYNKVPVLVYLAGLTCTEDNGAQKGGFLSVASVQGIALLFPDTSPRGAGIEGETDSWDFGVGAGFYLNATNPKYAAHYNMLTHITLELPQVLEAAGIPIVSPARLKFCFRSLKMLFRKDFTRQSIFGHSMGGHGALTLYLASKSKQYRSASAFAPIANPTKCPWGQKAFNGYLQGGVEEAKSQYDAAELISKAKEPLHILIDYGKSDEFYNKGELLPENFLKAAREAGYNEVQSLIPYY